MTDKTELAKKRAEYASQARKLWEGIYAGDEYIFGVKENDYFAGQIQALPKGSRILMVADGEGRNSVYAASLGHQVDAFDLSPTAVEKARKLAKSRGVSVNYSIASTDEWDWKENMYDCVTFLFCQFATPNMRKRMFEGAMRTLKKGGLMVVFGYNPKQIEYGTGGPSNVAQLYTEDYLREQFASLTITDLKVFDAVVDDGPRHQGMSALIAMTAVK